MRKSAQLKRATTSNARIIAMPNDKKLAQMSSKPGFIAALDQSGPAAGALKLYGIRERQ
jgi:fructose-bisphosphate aldolase class 1